MPRAREEVLDAALSYFDGSENRLTELLATVLDYHDAFARALFERADIDLPGDGVRFEVYTQKAVAEGARPDMVVLALRGPTLVAQLWSEHKVGEGEFRDLQLEDYGDALSKERSPGRLIGIVGEVKSDREGEDWRMFTWQEVAELANSVGRQAGFENDPGRGWRTAALAPMAPACARLLHEFIWYLEKEGDAVVDALDRENVQAFQKMAETTTGILALLDRAAQHMRPAFDSVEEDLGGEEDGSRFWQIFKAPEDSWVSRFGAAGFEAYPELMLSADDRWWSESRDEPAFAAGYTLSDQLYEPLAADEEWVKRLTDKAVDLAVYDGLVRVFCTTPMTSLLERGDTLDEQSRALAEFAKESLNLIDALAPYEFPLPSKRRRRRRAVGGDGADDTTDTHRTQRITERDINDGVLRIPQGTTKGLFPMEKRDVQLELRGKRLSCAWDPKFARGGKRERSGRLSVGRQRLAQLVEPDEYLLVEKLDGLLRLS